jgi:hypothetical protein
MGRLMAQPVALMAFSASYTCARTRASQASSMRATT